MSHFFWVKVTSSDYESRYTRAMVSSRRHQNTRGSVLSFVVIALGITLITVCAITGAVQMATVADVRIERKIQAEDAAKNAIMSALVRIRSGEVGLRDRITYGRGENAASLTFDSSGRTPYATNNLESSSAVSGWDGRLVPGKCVHLVSVGESGGEKVVRELLVSMDAFPWSIASNGSLRGNDVKVFAVPSLASVADGITEDEKLKSDILSNGQGEAIVLTGSSEVEGNAKAVGDVLLHDSAVVKGERLSGQAITQLDIRKSAADYDPDVGGHPSLVYGPSVQKIEGRYVAEGDVTVGDLELADGLLFVRGNVTVTGNIRGKGALVATGNITINGSMNTSADMAALVSGGNISIQGSGENTSSFQGLVLAEGSFSARDTRILGTVVAKDTEGVVELERVQMVRSKDLTKMELDYDTVLRRGLENDWGGGGGGGSNGVSSSAAKVGVLYQRNTHEPGIFIEWKLENYDALKALAEQIKSEGGTSVVKIRDARELYLDAPPREIQRVFSAAQTSWRNYIGQVQSDTVATENIFQLDFNEFLRAKGRLRPLYQKVSSFED